MEGYTENQVKELSSEWVKRNLIEGAAEELEWKRVENTPFTLAGGKMKNENGDTVTKWKIFCGHEIACYNVFESEGKAREYIGIIPWDLVQTAISAIMEYEYGRHGTKKEGQ